MSTLSLTSKRVNGMPVLMYHQISDPAQAGSRLAVSPAAFAGQVRHLSENGYITITAGELAAALAGTGPALPPRPVVLTFDDGYADFHTEALPLLREHGCTATVFVTTGWLADAGPHAAGPAPGPMLTWSQVGELAAAGIEIAAHSHTHPQLDQLRPGRLQRELTLSKDLLEDRLGTPVPGLAYPFGYSSAAVRQAVARAGYRYAYAVANTIVRYGPDEPVPDKLTSDELTPDGLAPGGLARDELDQSRLGQDEPAQSGLTQRGLTQSGLAPGGLARDELDQSRLGQDEPAQSGLTQSGLTQRGLPQSGLAPDGLARDELDQSRLGQDKPAQSGLTQRELTQSGLAPDGLAQSGLVQDGLAQIRLDQNRLGPDLLALPRLTIRSSTRPREFAQIAAGQVPLTFVKDWSLTRGYAVVRRARAALSQAGASA